MKFARRSSLKSDIQHGQMFKKKYELSHLRIVWIIQQLFLAIKTANERIKYIEFARVFCYC
jgi:hypothetical protein